MKPNIGIINALIRITVGFTILAWSISKLVWRPYRDSYLFAAMMGGMKIAEGITKYCPVTALFENNQILQKEDQHEDHEEVDLSAINPS